MIPERCKDRLKQLNAVFLEENAKLNLSAFRTKELSWVGNVMDSLAVLDTQLINMFSAPSSENTSIPRPLPPQEEGENKENNYLEKEKWKKDPVPSNIRFYAREMRKDPTEAESLLWKHIRYDQLGVRFRRQYYIDGCIFDFYCPSLRFAIELDGNIHEEKVQKKNDGERDDHFLQERQITTLRFNNDDVINDTTNILNSIRKHIQQSSPPPVEEGSGVEAVVEEGSGVEAVVEEGSGVEAVVEEGSGVEAVVEEGVGVEKCSILDLGTGGGFPLLPLAICLPQCQLTGVDATQKKVAAVERIANALEVKNVNIIAGRAEELGHDKTYREQFDLVLSRAVAPINTLLEYCAPFTKVKGHIVLWKSMKIEQELKDSLLARAELSCHLTAQHEYELPEKFGKRQLLIFEKTFQTSEKYPREIGIPKKNPIV